MKTVGRSGHKQCLWGRLACVIVESGSGLFGTHLSPQTQDSDYPHPAVYRNLDVDDGVILTLACSGVRRCRERHELTQLSDRWSRLWIDGVLDNIHVMQSWAGSVLSVSMGGWIRQLIFIIFFF